MRQFFSLQIDKAVSWPSSVNIQTSFFVNKHSTNLLHVSRSRTLFICNNGVTNTEPCIFVLGQKANILQDCDFFQYNRN